MNKPKRQDILRIGLIVGFGLIVAACQAIHLPLPRPTTPVVIPQESAAPADSLDDESPAAKAEGRLAYIGADGNVYVTTASPGSTIAITNDATTGPEGPGLSYHRVSWSPDGRLAFAAVTRLANEAARSRLYVAAAPGEPAQLVGRNDEHFVIYIYWSPVPCPDRSTCRRLAYLIEEEDAVSLRLVDMKNGQVENRRIGLGRPFYFSWRPDGGSILWHNGGRQRRNPEARLGLYDISAGASQALPQAPGLFLAPAWSPGGEQWLGVVSEGAVDRLQSVGAEQTMTVTTASDRPIEFAWSPQGDQIAYAVQEEIVEPSFGPIHLFDLKTGQSRRLTDVGFRIRAFFWSPDGQRIGYITKLPLRNTEWMQWRVYDVAGNEDRGFKAFLPSFQMRFVLGSFNQFAQSHRLWSPDGRHLVYADQDRNLVEQIWLIDTQSDDGHNTTLVAEGSMGFWSWE